MAHPDDPKPPSRWPRRLGLGVLFLVFALVAAHLLWGSAAKGRLDARVANLRAAGEPIDPADFVTPLPPPGQNAADDLLAAEGLLTAPGAIPDDFDRLRPQLPLTDAEVAILRRTLDAHGTALSHIESAAAKPAVHWNLDPAIPSAELATIPGIKGARGAANLLRADALLAHQSGDDARALARIEQILALSRHIDRQPILISHLVATGIHALASDAAQDLAPDLRVGPPPAGVPRARVRAVIDQLLDDKPLRAGLVHAVRGERKDHWLILTQAGTPRPLPAGGRPAFPPMNPVAAFLYKPVLAKNADLLVRMGSAVIKGFESSTDLPTYRATVNLNRLFPEIAGPPRLYLFASIIAPSHERFVQVHYRAVTEGRLAATALALRCYAADHAGQLPPTLDALVPDYLPAIPIDPMSADRAPLRYNPAAPNPILYSVGDDATDQAGSQQPSPRARSRPGEPLDRWQAQDAVLPLTRQPRRPPAEPPPP